jgi:hypothetical protein
MSSLFVAHSSLDKPFARRLTRDLQSLGVKVWLDEAELLIGDSLIAKIQSAITDMEYLAAVLSVNSVQSPWVQKELEVALSMELSRQEVKVLPIVIDDCLIPPFLIGKVYADFRSPQNYDIALRRLLLRLGPPSPVVVEHDDEMSAKESIAALRVAESVINGTPVLGQSLNDAAAVLFSLLDGSGLYFSASSSFECGAFFAAFADVYPPALLLLLNIAENGDNTDYVIVGAIFGLALTRSIEGQRAFMKALTSPRIDIFEKMRSLEVILKHSRLSLRDLPVNVWDLIHTHSGESHLDQDDYQYLKRIEPSGSCETLLLRPEWITILKTGEYLKDSYYRGEPTRTKHIDRKRQRIRLARLGSGVGDA